MLYFQLLFIGIILCTCTFTTTLSDPGEKRIPKHMGECLRFAGSCKNVTKTEIYKYCKRLMDIHGSLLHRKRRNAGGCSGVRIRKEIRHLSPEEWKNFTDAVNALKKSGEYNLLASIHRGPKNLAVHNGPNFLGWHRVILLYFEMYLQLINPCVALPYWDSSLDYEMYDPTDSILFTEKFFGNGKGIVTTGPFAKWVTGRGQYLERDIGTGGTLISRDHISMFLSRTKHNQIIGKKADNCFSIEKHSKGPHVWVDGHMILYDETTEDPIFWMHHAFIDCLWQMFIERNSKGDSSWAYNDYPPVKGLHAADKIMKPFEYFTNRDGYNSSIYDEHYRCGEIPSCSYQYDKCTSPYLECDPYSYRCISISRRIYKKRKRAANRKNNRKPKPGPSTRKYSSSQHSSFDKKNSLSKLAIPEGKEFTSFYKDKRDKGTPIPQKVMDLLPSPDYHQLRNSRLSINSFEEVLLTESGRGKAKEGPSTGSKHNFLSCDDIKQQNIDQK